jgi:hypothetical protein
LPDPCVLSMCPVAALRTMASCLKDTPWKWSRNSAFGGSHHVWEPLFRLTRKIPYQVSLLNISHENRYLLDYSLISESNYLSWSFFNLIETQVEEMTSTAPGLSDIDPIWLTVAFSEANPWRGLCETPQQCQPPGLSIKSHFHPLKMIHSPPREPPLLPRKTWLLSKYFKLESFITGIDNQPQLLSNSLLLSHTHAFSGNCLLLQSRLFTGCWSTKILPAFQKALLALCNYVFSSSYVHFNTNFKEP